MLHLWRFQWLLFYFLLGQLHIQHAKATWPLSDTSGIQLLDLFQDVDNASESETTTLSVHSRAMFKAAIILSQQFNIKIEGHFIGWQAAQTGGNIINALSATCRAISTSNIIGIVGPAFSREAHVIAPLAEIIGIPTISYSATDPELSNKNAFSAFYRTVPSDDAAAWSIAKLFIRFNWTSCVIAYQADAFGSGGADAISKAFEKNNLAVLDTLVFDLSSLRFRGDLKTTLLESSTRIILVWAAAIYTPLILQSALDNDVLGPQFLWILSSSVSLNSFNQTFYEKLIGIITVEPAVGTVVGAQVNTTLLNNAYAIWQQYEPDTFPESTKVDNYALFAFDATWLLIQSFQELCSKPINSSSSCLSVVKSSFCFDNRFLNANSFFNTISTTQFLGVSGPIQFSNNTTDRIDGIYYIALNVQPSSNEVDYVPVLKSSNSGDWEAAAGTNVIIWPGSSLTPPTGLPAITGVHLRIGIFESPPFTMIQNIINGSGQNTTKYIGYVPDLIDLLKNRMGFIPEITLVSSNETYDYLVQAVADGVYDIVVAVVIVTAKRSEIVDFSSSIYDTSLRIIVRQSSSVSVDLFSYLKPFSLRLWLTILGARLYAAVLICILERRENEALKDKSNFSLVAMSVWLSFGTMTGYGVDFNARTAAGRLLSVDLYILAMILVATYTANLASNLTLQKSQNIISGIDDIKNGKIPYSRIGILVGSAYEDYYLQEISEGSRNFYPLTSVSETYVALLNNTIDASILDIGLLEYATNSIYCNLTLVGSDFNPSAYGIIFPKEWLYAQAFDINILSLRESGDLDTLRKTWFDARTCTDSSGTDTSTQIDIDAVGGLFLTFAIISVLSLFLFVWLKRSIMKDYLWTPANRKSSLAQHDGSVERHPTQFYYEPSQNYQPDSDSFLPMRF